MRGRAVEHAAASSYLGPGSHGKGTRVTPKRKALHLVNRLPRSIRARVAHASAHNTMNHKSGSSHEEGARSPTGRVALGPWAGTSEAHPGSPTSAQSSRGGDMSERSHGTHSQQYAVLAEVVPARDASTLAAHPGLTPHMLMMMANENGHSPPPTAHRRHAYHASDTPVQYAPARGERVRTMMGIFQPRSSYF